MKTNILVIFDDNLLMDDLLKALHGLRCRVKTADTGFMGIRMLDQEQFDAVIIDLFSLDFDGKAVARHVGFTKSQGSRIVVGLSEKLESIDMDEFDQIFSSPLSTSDLVEILNLCTRKKTLI